MVWEKWKVERNEDREEGKKKKKEGWKKIMKKGGGGKNGRKANWEKVVNGSRIKIAGPYTFKITTPNLKSLPLSIPRNTDREVA